MEYIESLPESVLSEFMALDVITPFTPSAGSYREGLMCSLLYNNNATKQSDTKSVEELFPYMKQGIPEWLEDKRILKAKSLFSAISNHSADLFEINHKQICEKIKEEIQIEQNKSHPDQYIIGKLKELINKDK